MYENIGGKIKGLAQTLCIIEAAVAMIYGLVLMGQDDDLAVLGFLVMVLGSLFAWISSWLLYGFGELIEKTSEIASNTRKESFRPAPHAPHIDQERIARIRNLRDQGVISEDEFQQAMAKIYKE